jgi:hypothetical protein
MPKTPEELKAEIERENKQPAPDGKERTAEGEEVETPKRKDFFGNLEKASRAED